MIARSLPEPGLADTHVPGLQLFHVAEPVPCVPVVYDPCIVAIVGGEKEAIVEGERHRYDADRYLLCTMTLPVGAGTPEATPEAPLLGAVLTLDAQVMRTLTMEAEAAGALTSPVGSGRHRLQPLSLARWDTGFAEALLRLVEVSGDPVDAAVLGPGRVRELCYAVLKGEAGADARHAFGPRNGIARAIEELSRDPSQPVSVAEMAARAGMSRAAFHRRFKEATRMSPLQFVKAMRLNGAARMLAGGKSVTQVAWETGYASTSQFSREFKRVYGQSPRRWRHAAQLPAGIG